VIFQPSARPAFKLTEPRVIAFDTLGRVQFTMDAGYVQKLTDGAAAQVYEWDPRDRRIRITDGASPVWIRCAVAAVDGLACSDARLRVTADGTISVTKVVRDSASRGMAPAGRSPLGAAGLGSAFLGNAARGIPNCPGDPRCPKL
jgi:hypothetical protein